MLRQRKENIGHVLNLKSVVHNILIMLLYDVPEIVNNGGIMEHISADTNLKDHGADQVFQLHYKECSGTDQDRLRYWARARVREKCKGHAGVDGAGGVCVDGPVSRTYRAVAAETECCYCWMKGSLLGS